MHPILRKNELLSPETVKNTKVDLQYFDIISLLLSFNTAKVRVNNRSASLNVCVFCVNLVKKSSTNNGDIGRKHTAQVLNVKVFIATT